MWERCFEWRVSLLSEYIREGQGQNFAPHEVTSLLVRMQ